MHLAGTEVNSRQKPQQGSESMKGWGPWENLEDVMRVVHERLVHAEVELAGVMRSSWVSRFGAFHIN